MFRSSRGQMSLTLEKPNRISRGDLAKGQELNIRISAAVCDRAAA